MGRAIAPSDLPELAAMPCFEGVDVATEFTKAQRWLVKYPKRQMTRQFFLNWLRKCPARPARPASPSYEDTF